MNRKVFRIDFKINLLKYKEYEKKEIDNSVIWYDTYGYNHYYDKYDGYHKYFLLIMVIIKILL